LSPIAHTIVDALANDTGPRAHFFWLAFADDVPEAVYIYRAEHERR